MTQSVGGREPLQATLQLVRLTEGELRIQLRRAIVDLDKILLDPRLSSLRRAQYQIAMVEIQRQLRELWAGPIADSIEIGKRRAADAAADSAYDMLQAYAVRDGVTLFSRESLRATAREGINSLISRSSNNVSLAERVYKNGTGAGSAISRVINTGLTTGQSARDIAKAARSHIDPDTPGGTSYAAMRLARTEINNAFHTTTSKTMAANPFVESMKWNLSKSHPVLDVCDKLAAAGPYPAAQLPSKPHPQCFCFMTAEVVDEDDFVRNFKSGSYNDYLDRRLRGEEDYEVQERSRAAALLQRRVIASNGRQYALTDLSPQARAQYLTVEERSLLRRS